MSSAPPSRAELRRARQRRRHVVIAVGAAALVVTLAAAVLASASVFSDDDRAGDGDGRGAAASATSSSAVSTTTIAAAAGGIDQPATTAPATAATAPPPVDVGRRYAVGTYQVTYVDPSRSTSPNGSFGGAPTRTLDTTYWFPALADGGEPDRAHGPYPVVLFVHGYDQTADFYAPLLERWASAGYVVIGPTYPILSGIPGGPSHVDYNQLFGDTTFVIDQTLAAAGTPIAGLADGGHIAAAGHSDGEMVSFTLGFAQCCREPRIRSVITMAGDLSNAGIDPLRDTGMPILHVMETNDEYDPYPHSIGWDRDNLTAPRWMLTLVNGSHVPPYTQPGNPYFELVSVATVDFLDGTLKGRTDRLDQLAADVAAHPDIANLER